MKIRDNKIWDDVRGRWLVLTPEEWVRQATIEHLTDNLKVEPHRIGREVLLSDGKRADLVVYDHKAQPILIVECKAQNIKITQDVFEQIACYNMNLGIVRYLAVTNGKELYCCEFDAECRSYRFLKNLPEL